MTTMQHDNWGWRSRTCLIGAAGAVLAASARLIQEAYGAEVHFMPLASEVPGWLAADVTVIVSAIIGGAVAQIGSVLFTWLKQEL
jgi:hypothetical protein